MWSLCVRARDGKCLITGNTETLQAHHWIVSSSRSLKYRYDVRNGVSLSFTAHRYGVHTEASYAYTRRIAEAMVAAGNVTWEEIEEIRNDPTKTTDYNREELNAILARLTKELEDILAKKQADRTAKPGTAIIAEDAAKAASCGSESSLTATVEAKPGQAKEPTT